MSVIDTARATWDQYVGELRSKESELNANEASLRVMRDQLEMDGPTLAIWQDAIGKIDSTRAQIGWILTAINSAGAWWENANALPETPVYGGEFWFLNEHSQLQGLSGLGSLGIAWLAPVPIAAIIAAIALLTHALSYVGERVGLLNSAIGTYQQMRSANIPHREALEAANALIPESMLESVKKIGYTGLIALLAIFFLPKILDALPKGR